MPAENKQNKNSAAENTRELIDPIYERFTRGVLRSIGSTEFYEYFMDAVSKAKNEIQFSNRKLEKFVDTDWVDAIEDALGAMQNIIASPRNAIKEDEFIVNIANAKKSESDTVRHLAQHANLVDDFDDDTGEVHPSRLMQKYREESQELYENRLTFTVMEQAFHFVKIRYDALIGAMGEEYGAKLKVTSDMTSARETMHMDMFLHIRERDDILQTDNKNSEVFSRISRLYRVLNSFMTTEFSQQLSKFSRVHGNIVRTNVLKKNPQYKQIAKLYDFLRGYDQIGYVIRVKEQSPVINEKFQQDIYHNILFNYIILKGYLADESDREIPGKAKVRERTLKPKFIRQIIEELTEDYDLPDVEVRKVLIEELTKAQLMQEEAAERRRLVDEQAQRKREEAERLKREQEEERERIRKEKEAERERIRQEQEQKRRRELEDRMLREQAERRRANIFRKEYSNLFEHLTARLEARQEAGEALSEAQDDFADAVVLMEAEELRRKTERSRLRIKREEERERKERERLAAEEAIRREQEAAAERARIEEERLRLEQEMRETAEARAALAPYLTELDGFSQNFQKRMAMRREVQAAENKLRKRKEKIR